MFVILYLNFLVARIRFVKSQAQHEPSNLVLLLMVMQSVTWSSVKCSISYITFFSLQLLTCSIINSTLFTNARIFITWFDSVPIIATKTVQLIPYFSFWSRGSCRVLYTHSEIVLSSRECLPTCTCWLYSWPIVLWSITIWLSIIIEFYHLSDYLVLHFWNFHTKNIRCQFFLQN